MPIGQPSKAVDEFAELTQKIFDGKYEQVTTKELEMWIHTHPTSGVLHEAQFELQKRQTYESIIAMKDSAKWTKIMSIATFIMALATIALAIITHLKP